MKIKNKNEFSRFEYNMLSIHAMQIIFKIIQKHKKIKILNINECKQQI